MIRLLFFAPLLLIACKTVEPTPAPTPVLAAAQAPPPKPIHLTLVGTNDIHGWVMPIAEGGVRFGGLATLAAYLKIVRDENAGGVLLLDAGDLFQGTLASNLSEGAVVIDALNALGYDAAAIGNHEFDFGPVGPHVTASPGENPFGALEARLAQARFPILSANIYDKTSGDRPAWLKGDGTAILERKGVKVGIVGLTTPSTPQTTMPVNVATLRFGDLAADAAAGAKRVREKGAQLVVVVVHAGGRCAKWDDPYDTSSCNLDVSEAFGMLRELPEHTVDAVVAGHSHDVIAHVFKGTPIIETWGMARTFSTIELFVDPTTHAVMPQLTKITGLNPICETVDEQTGSCDARRLKGRAVKAVPATFHGKPIVPDAVVAKLIQPGLDQVTQLQQKKLGVSVPATLGRDYEAESALGSFLADTLRGMEKADVAVLNPGGLRADLKAGELTYGAVFEVMPFDNTVATLDLSGAELKRLLKVAFGSRKGVFQISGIEVKLSKCVGPERLQQVTLDRGKPLADAKRFRVVMPDFLARGGDGLASVLGTIEPSRIDFGQNRELNFRDAMVAYWQQRKKPLEAPRSGRVAVVANDKPCPEPQED